MFSVISFVLAGMDTDYLWFLSRSPEVSDELADQVIELSTARNFNIENLIFIDHKKQLQ